jgi:hypothetical protein
MNFFEIQIETDTLTGGSKMKRKMTLSILCALGLLLMLGTAVAGEKVERTGKASAHGVVYIENMVGSIEVIGWGKNEVKLEGTLGDDVEELEFKTGNKKSVIEVVYPRNMRNIEDGAELVIHVPEGSRVSVEGVSAWVSVSKVKGEVEASSISGDVTVTGDCESVEAESISGTVEVDSGARQIMAESISGKVLIKGEEAEVEAASVSGDVQLEFHKFLELSVESVSGTVVAIGDLHPKGEFSFDTVSGSITLMVPGDVSATFEITTFNGGIDNAFGQKARKTSRYAPGRELEFSVGGGDAEVEINSFSGDIRIKKK